MKYSKKLNLQRWRRKNRVRKKLRGTAECPRLNVHRSNKHIYCQLIDDESGKTIASASTRDKDMKVKFGGNVEAAKQVGSAIAEKAKSAGVSQRFASIAVGSTSTVAWPRLPMRHAKADCSSRNQIKSKSGPFKWQKEITKNKIRKIRQV